MNYHLKQLATLFLGSLILFSCSKPGYINTESVNTIAESYVKLAFSLGMYDEDYIDGYFGPEELKTAAFKDTLSLQDIINYSDDLEKAVEKYLERPDNSSELHARLLSLKSLIVSLRTRAEMASGINYTFDIESELLYDVVSPVYSLESYKTSIALIDSLLPGTGDINTRWNAFRKAFIVPVNKLDTLFSLAFSECRARTYKYIPQKENDFFTYEFVDDASWGAYNWFKGNGTSLIQINRRTPIYFDRVLDLVAHEAYPGHHVFHSLHEAVLYKRKGWIEFSIIPLFSPKAVISEGLANFAIEILFDENEKQEFEKNILCKIAGINTKQVDLYYSILNLMSELQYASTESARRYLDGKITKEQAINFLMNYRLRTAEEAERNIEFFEKYRSYILTYSIGLDLVRNYFASENPSSPEQKWELYYKLMSTPVLPSDLRN